MNKSGKYNTAPSGPGIEIISSREKHGYFRQAVPKMPLVVAVALCVVNFVLPGIGTLISGFTVWCGCKSECESPKEACAKNVLAAFLQIVTTVILVGWIWSIFWGVQFINEASKKEETEAQGDV